MRYYFFSYFVDREFTLALFFNENFSLENARRTPSTLILTIFEFREGIDCSLIKTSGYEWSFPIREAIKGFRQIFSYMLTRGGIKKNVNMK